jgi:serine/threonine protein kinase
MAPEQARGEIADLDERTDVFGLGAILYFLLTDRAPFSDKRREAEERAIPPLLRTLNPKLPKALQAICHTAMSFNADDRYQTVSELLSDIQRFAAGGAVSAYRENPAERAARWVRNNHFIVLLVVAYLVMRLLLIFYSRS